MTVIVDVDVDEWTPPVQYPRRHAAWALDAQIDVWDCDHVTSAPVPDEAAKRGYEAINQLVTQGYVSSAIATRGKELINFLFKPNTVDAAVSPDDDALSFYWVAQEMSLTILVYQSWYWWSVREIAGDSYSGEGSDLRLNELEHSLIQFSKEVERRNPDWRRVIR
ncbi:hypothetical protein ACFWE3_22685 [Mycobacteriaceae bacterium NPDC060252]